mmetsp:Transcript_72387/g.130266  ORF Transcript_72387/g.130266 Transcript_72387/m.130266 type:complete len:235 (-) Transcript_72387:159-863(-)
MIASRQSTSPASTSSPGPRTAAAVHRRAERLQRLGLLARRSAQGMHSFFCAHWLMQPMPLTLLLLTMHKMLLLSGRKAQANGRCLNGTRPNSVASALTYRIFKLCPRLQRHMVSSRARRRSTTSTVFSTWRQAGVGYPRRTRHTCSGLPAASLVTSQSQCRRCLLRPTASGASQCTTRKASCLPIPATTTALPKGRKGKTVMARRRCILAAVMIPNARSRARRTACPSSKAGEW